MILKEVEMGEEKQLVMNLGNSILNVQKKNRNVFSWKPKEESIDKRSELPTMSNIIDRIKAEIDHWPSKSMGHRKLWQSLCLWSGGGHRSNQRGLIRIGGDPKREFVFRQDKQRNMSVKEPVEIREDFILVVFDFLFLSFFGVFFKQMHCDFRFWGEVMTQNFSSFRNFVICARLKLRHKIVENTCEIV